MLLYSVYSESNPGLLLSLSNANSLCLPALTLECTLPDHFSPAPKSFRMNTCKSVTKQITLTSFRMNTYKKHRGKVALWLTYYPKEIAVPRDHWEPRDLLK
jgi:hypothetical protein